MKTIFLSFTISDSSLSEFYIVLANKLSATFNVVVIADRVEPHPFVIDPAISVYTWPSGRPVKPSDFIFLLRKIVKYKPVTMVSMFGSMNIFLICGFLAGVKNRIAWCHSLYEKTPDRKTLDIRKKIIYRLATKVIANSNATRQDLITNFDVLDSKIMRVSNAVREGRRSPEINRNEIVFAGRLQKLKGLDTLLEAMKIVNASLPEVKLRVIGGLIGGNTIKNYQEKCMDLGVEKNVVFAGRFSKNQVLDAFSKAWLVVVPSYLEAFGLVVIESFSVGTPVVGSDTSGIAEIVRHEKDGLLSKPGDAAGLATQIIRLLKDQDLREEFSRNCFQRFREQYELGQATDKLFLRLNSLS